MAKDAWGLANATAAVTSSSVEPLLSDRAASRATDVFAMFVAAAESAARQSPSTSSAAGSTIANSAVTEPRSSAREQRTANHVEKDGLHFVSSKDDHEESGEADRGHGCDGVFSGS